MTRNDKAIILTLFFASNFIFSQQIEIKTTPNDDFSLIISEEKDVFDIKLKILDSISSNKKYLSKFDKIARKMEEKRETFDIKLSKKLKNLIENNSYYSDYNIKVDKSADNEYLDLFNHILQSNEKQLNRIDDNNITLHGQSISINITQNQETLKLYQNTADKEKHPYTTKLITSTLQFLRDKNMLNKNTSSTYGF